MVMPGLQASGSVKSESLGVGPDLVLSTWDYSKRYTNDEMEDVTVLCNLYL